MNAWFGNISVKHKLTIGFSFVLLLTMALALVSWNSLDSVMSRTHRMLDINGLTADLTELRVARMRYLLSNGAAEDAKLVQQHIEQFTQNLTQATANFRNPDNLQRFQQQRALIQQYQQAFTNTQAAFANVKQLREQLPARAEQADALLEPMMAEVSNNLVSEEQRFARYQALARIKNEVQTLRYRALAYTTDVSERTEQALNQQIARVDQDLTALTSTFGDDYREQVQQLIKIIGDYRTLLSDLKTALVKLVQLRDSLTEHGQQIVALAGQLAHNQSVLSERDNALASRMLIGTALAALLAGLFSAWLITRQITRPLKDTLVAVERIAAGDLSQRLEVSRRDELGAVQQGIQHMAATLRELIGGIRDGVTQIASAAEELSAVTGQTSAGVNSQKIETDQVATAMHQMSTTVQEVARHAAEASQAASDTDREASNGDRLVAAAIAQIERMATEVSRSFDAMTHLQSESTKIGGVMVVIKQVAEQTNLLALNAAIEAARAGEAGRGFAVVADEVRGLAQRTQKSTEEIEGLIAGLQQGTHQVATFMQASREMTDGSVALTREAGAALGVITRKVSNIQSMNQQIAAAAEQQGAVAEEISRSVVNVRDISEQTAAASEETAASSVELARLGSQLQNMVSHFRV